MNPEKQKKIDFILRQLSRQERNNLDDAASVMWAYGCTIREAADALGTSTRALRMRKDANGCYYWNLDINPAMLTPGEIVIKRDVERKAINPQDGTYRSKRTITAQEYKELMEAKKNEKS